MDKLKKIFSVNKRVFVFLLGLMFIGVIFGSSLPIFLNNEDKVLVSEYLSNFVSQINNGYDSLFLFKNSLINNGIFAFLIWILGVSIIGIPIILFLFFFKSFVFGFSISSIIVNYGFKGILFSFSYIFPHQVINLCVYGVLTNYSLIFSIKLIGMIFKKVDFNIRGAFNRYFRIFIFCFLVLILSSLFESFISPLFMGFVFRLLSL